WRTRSDAASITRLRELLPEPRRVEERVRFYVEVAPRRWDRWRQIVLHGGSSGGVATPARLRVTPPLADATLDRMTQAYRVAGVPPLVLACRAETELRIVDDDLGPGLCDLID